MIFRTRRDLEEEILRRISIEREREETWRKCIGLENRIEGLEKRMMCLEEELRYSRKVMAVNPSGEVTE